MHIQEAILNNEMNKFLWFLEIQTDHIISARRPNRVRILKKKKKTWKTMEDESDVYTNCYWRLGTVT